MHSPLHSPLHCTALLASPNLVLAADRPCPFCPDLVPALRVQYAELPADLQRLRAAKQGPLSSSSEAATATVLRGALQGMRSQYSSSSLGEDEERLQEWGLLESSPLDLEVDLDERGACTTAPSTATAPSSAFIPPHERAKSAFVLCYGEKKILEEAIAWLDEHSTDLTFLH